MLIYVYISAGFSEEIHTAVVNATDHLNACYVKGRFSSSKDDWPPYQPEHYIPLALIHSGCKSPVAAVISFTQELAVIGKITDNSAPRNQESQYRVLKYISDIFAPVTTSDGSVRYPSMILIEGAPGIGKTVLAKEIAFQWATKKLLTNKQLLFLVFLRECNLSNMTTVEGFVEYIIKSSSMVNCISKHLFETKGKDLVIVFDGYDEISVERGTKSFIAEIIERNVFPQCCLVITSRPTASSHLHNLVDCRVEIAGFTEKDRFEYIQTALEGNDHQIKGLQQYLQSNPTINALCYIPLNMTILLSLTGDGLDRLPKTQTEMYRKFIEITIRRFVKKVDDKEVVNINIAELPYPHNEVFKELAKLAFKALQGDTIVFTLAEIRSSCPKLTETTNWNGLGLLKAVQHFNTYSGNEEVTFHFLHFSIQEYMAAYYISTLSDDEQVKLLKRTFWEHRYYNTWIMYVGITSATSFALRHFLSGHKIKLFTKMFPTFKMSDKLLNDKVKCLHLFQCLEESKSKDVAVIAGKFLQGQEIDLSRQPLLPSDLNTIGFFLCRSITKQWETLNISRCHIGVTGCDILCNRFLDKEGHDIIKVKRIDLSHNQLSIHSLLRLLDLCKSLHTSELIITDDSILTTVTSNTLLAAVEENFVQYGESSSLKLLLIGSLLYANHLEEKTLLNHLSNTEGIKSFYFIHCNWDSNLTEVSNWYSVLTKHIMNIIHIVGFHTSVTFISALVSVLAKQRNLTDLFVYDTSLSDGVVNGLVDIPINVKNTSYLRLVISSGKIQGLISTTSLSDHLSPLELLNFSKCIKKYDHSQVCLWENSLHGDCSSSEFVMYCLSQHVTYTKCNCLLKTVIVEGDTLFASSTTVEHVSMVTIPSDKSRMFLYRCELSISKTLLFQCKILYIINSHINKCSTRLLLSNPTVQELFMHGIIEVSIDDLVQNIIITHPHTTSVLLVTENVMIGHNPTTKQIALAFQLEPSITVWKLPNCQVTADVFYQLTSQLTATPTNWTELNFEGCNITDIECESIHQHLRHNRCQAYVKTLRISLNKLTSSLCTIIEIILYWKVQFFFINETASNFHNTLTSKILSFLTLLACKDKINLSVIAGNRKSCFFRGVHLNDMTVDDQVSEVYFINCHIKASSQLPLILKENCSIVLWNSNISKAVIIELLEEFQNSNTEILIYDESVVRADIICNSIPSLYHMNTRFVLMTDSILYGFNATQNQLNFIQQAKKWKLHCIGHSIVEEVNLLAEKGSAILQNKEFKAVYFVARKLQKMHKSQINVLLECATSLKVFGIENYIVTDETADSLACILSHNTTLEEIHLKKNILSSTAATGIFKCLCCIPKLKVISFCNNHITDQLADNKDTSLPDNRQAQSSDKLSEVFNIANTKARTASVNVATNQSEVTSIMGISPCNLHLQSLDLSGNCFQGTSRTLLCKTLQGIAMLTKFSLNSTKINDEVAGDVATALSESPQLQEIDLSNSLLTSASTKNILNAMKKFSNLKALRMANSNINNKLGKLLASILCHNFQLEELDVSRNNLGSTGCVAICRSLQKALMLMKLFLSGNSIISDEEVDEITYTLNKSTQLQELGLCLYVKSSVGVTNIVNGISKMSNLKLLSITLGNISNTEIKMLSQNLSNHLQLSELDLHGNNLQTVGCKLISNALLQSKILTKLILSKNNITDEAADGLSALLSCNTQLKEFYIDGNCLQAKGVGRIAQGLKNTSTLNKLYMGGNHISNKAVGDIASILSCNTHIQELELQISDLQLTDCMKISAALQYNSALCKLIIVYSNITDESAVSIAAVLSHNTKLQELNLDGNFLGLKGTKVIMKALINTSTLVKLSIQDNRCTEDAAHDIAHVVSHNTGLQELNVQGNNLQTAGVIKIAKALQKLTMLIKVNVDDVCDEAADDVASFLHKFPELEEISFCKNKLTLDGIRKIAIPIIKFTNLKVFRMAKSNVNHKTVQIVADILCHHMGLKELDLSENNLQATGCGVICKALQKLSTLTKIFLSSNNITDEVADNVAGILSNNTLLREFDFSNNQITAVSTDKVVNAMKNLTNLKVLRMVNSNITTKSAELLGSILCNNMQLQELNLSTTNLEATGCAAICKALQQIRTLTKLKLSNNRITDEAADDIATILSYNVQLRELYINQNCFQSLTVRKFAVALRNNTTLMKLYVGSNNISNEAVYDLADILSHNTQLQELELQINGLLPIDWVRISDALQHTSSLLKLIIINSNITSESADSITTVLSHNAQLQEFICQESNILPMVCAKFSQALQHNSILLKLIIVSGNITSESAHSIAEVLSHNTQLQELNLDGNCLKSKGIKVVMKALEHTTTLVKLSIQGNHCTEDAAHEIAGVISHNFGLKELNLQGNNLQTAGIMVIIQALQKLTTLIKISIDGICDETADHIADLFKRNINLQEINFWKSKLTVTCIVNVANCLKDLPALKILRITDLYLVTTEAEYVIDIVCSSVVHEQPHIVLSSYRKNLQTTVLTEISQVLEKISALTRPFYCSNTNNNCGVPADDESKFISSDNLLIREVRINVANVSRVALTLMKTTSTLTKLCMESEEHSNDAIDNIVDIISHNTELQELKIQNLLPGGWIKISNALKSTVTMVKLVIPYSNITGESAYTIAAVLSHNAQLQELNLDGNILRLKGTVTVMRALANTTTLVKLSIQNNHCTEDAALDIAHVVSHNAGLQELNLQGNDLQAEGVITIAKALKQCSRSSKMNIENNSADVDSIVTFMCDSTPLHNSTPNHSLIETRLAKTEVMVKLCTNITVSRIMNFNQNYMANEFNSTLSYCRFEDFDLNSTTSQSKSFAVECRALNSISALSKVVCSTFTDNEVDIATVMCDNYLQLKDILINGGSFQTTSRITVDFRNILILIKVHIGNDSISNEAVDDVANILSLNTKHKELSLQISNLLSHDCMKLSNALRCTSSLFKLILMNCNITSESAGSIAAVLTHNTQLQELNLDGNLLTYSGTIKILKGLENTSTLIKLSIQDNHCSAGAAVCIAEVISRNTGLQELNLQGNDLQTEGAIKIAEALKTLSKLIKLNINDNAISDWAVEDMVAVLAHNHQLATMFYSQKNLFSSAGIEELHFAVSKHQFNVLYMHHRL